jgi:MFS family permease
LPASTPIGLALFAGAMALGRFAADALVMRHGPTRVIGTGALACALALGATASLGSLALAMVSLVVCGFGLAAAAPILFSAAGRLGGETLARVIALGALGALFGPLVLGEVARSASLAAVMGVLAALSGVIAWQSRALRERAAAPAAVIEALVQDSLSAERADTFGSEPK